MTMKAIICCVLSAAAFWFGHGVADVWPLAWLAPAPVLWLAYGEERAWRVGAVAFLAYLVGQGGLLSPYLPLMGPIVVVLAAVPALAFTGAVMAARLAWRRLPAAAAAFVFPALWTVLEWGYSLVSLNGSFGSWAYSQVSAPLLIQSAAVFGLWSITFSLALFASFGALLVVKRSRVVAGLMLALLAMNLAWGAWRLAQPAGPAVRVAASARDNVRAGARDMAASQAAEVRVLAGQGAQVIVFPEKVAPMPAAQRDAALDPLIAAARETGVTVVTGFDEQGPAGRRNAAYTITPAGVVGDYAKRHFVPGLETGYAAGPGAGLLGAGRSVAICKDMDFHATLRGDAIAGHAQPGGLRLMLVPAWDFDADAWTHARMAVMRGVEGGYAIARSASNGLVTLTDSRGRMVARGASGQTRHFAVVADLPGGTGPTPYLKIGDAFAWACGVLALILLGWAAVARRRV